MKKLWQFRWDCGRNGEVEGLFVADDQQIEDAVGKHVDFGEILGKHSEVFGTLDHADLKVLSIDQDFIEKCESIKGLLPQGYNPLDYLESN